MLLTLLCALLLLFSATVRYWSIFALFLSLFVPLWQDGIEEAVVYPDKLPIVSGGNFLWEKVPKEQDSGLLMKLTAEQLT